MSLNFWTSKLGAVIIFSAVIGLWISVPFITGWIAPKYTARGPFGDQFGSITALFSGLAFAGLILTLFMQSKELNLTRDSVRAQTEELRVSSEALKKQVEEMSNQRVEMQAMKEAQQAQVDYMAKQAFENTFFQILKLWNDHIESFDGRAKTAHVMAQVCADIGAYKPTIFFADTDNKPEDYYQREEEQRSLFYTKFKGDAELFLRPYIVLLLHCLKHISDAQMPQSDKKKYSEILRANLSPAEKRFLFFNCSFQHRKVLKPLIQEFAILSGLDDNTKNKNQHLYNKYDPKAFK